METILELDYQLFEWINQGWQNHFLDWLLPWWRAKETWIIFYLVLIVFLIYKYRLKGFYFVLFIALSVGISDTTSSKLIKKGVQRIRPCNHPGLQDSVRLLVRCGNGYSFTSSHATNHFTLAFLLLFTFCRRFKYLKLPLLLWAASIAIGQVYVGVHFPLDIVAGGLIGSLIGLGMAMIYRSLTDFRIADFYQKKLA